MENDFNIPTDDFDGKVVYGQKRANAGQCNKALSIVSYSNFILKMLQRIHYCFTGTGYQTHVEQMTPIVQQLAKLESDAQCMYLKRHMAQAC